MAVESPRYESCLAAHTKGMSTLHDAAQLVNRSEVDARDSSTPVTTRKGGAVAAFVFLAVSILLSMLSFGQPRSAVWTPPDPKVESSTELQRSRREVRLPLSRCFGHEAVERLSSTSASALNKIFEELGSIAAAPVNVTELVNLSTEGEWLHAGIRLNPFAPFATCEPPTNDGLRPGYGLLLHGVQLIVSGRREATDLTRARAVDAEKEFRMGIVIRVPVSMARRMRDESVFRHLLRRVAYGIAACSANPSRLLLKGMHVPVALWRHDLLPQCVLYDDGRGREAEPDGLDPPWVGEDGAFITGPAQSLLSVVAAANGTAPRERRRRRFMHVGGQLFLIANQYHGVFDPTGIALTAWMSDMGLQSVRKYAPYLSDVNFTASTFHAHPEPTDRPIGVKTLPSPFVRDMWIATMGEPPNLVQTPRTDHLGFLVFGGLVDATVPRSCSCQFWNVTHLDATYLLDVDPPEGTRHIQEPVDYFFVAAWGGRHWLWGEPAVHSVLRRWSHAVRPAFLAVHEVGEWSKAGVLSKPSFDWQRGAALLPNRSSSSQELVVFADGGRDRRFLNMTVGDNGLPQSASLGNCSSNASDASNVTPSSLPSDAITVLYDWRDRVHGDPNFPRIRGVHPDDERNITDAFHAGGVGLVRRVNFGGSKPRWPQGEQLRTLWRYPVIFFAEGAFMTWMLVARPNTTFVMYFETTSRTYARDELPYVYPVLFFAYHTFFRSQGIRLIVFVREVDRTASVDDLVSAVREPFESVFIFLRPGRNRTVHRQDSYPHRPAEELFARGLPLR